MTGPLERLLGPAPTLEALRARWGERYRWIALAVVMIGTVAAILTSTIVNVAFPAIGRAFDAGPERIQWVASGHMAAMTVAMLVLPWALGRFGFRRVFFAAMVMLFTGSLVGGLVSNLFALIAMRLVQGAAAGLLQPLATVLILRAFPPHHRGRATGVFGFGVVLAPAVGPAVGGLLVDAFGWRAVFFVALPFAVLGGLLAHRFLPTMSTPPGPARFDVMGFVLLAAFVVTLLETFVQWHDHGLLAQGSALWTLGSVALLAGWILWERRHPAPLINLGVFRHDGFRIGVTVALIYGAGLFGSTLMIPTFVQTGLHYTASVAGALLIPAGLALAVAIPIAGRLTDTVAPRVLVSTGLLLFGTSFTMLALWPQAGFWPVAMMLVVGRVGLGVILPSLTLGSVQQVDPAEVPTASSMFNFVRLLGGAIGTSLLPIFVEWRARGGLGHADATVSSADLIKAYQSGFWLLAAVFALAAVVSLRMKAEPRMRAAGQGGQAGPGDAQK